MRLCSYNSKFRRLPPALVKKIRWQARMQDFLKVGSTVENI